MKNIPELRHVSKENKILFIIVNKLMLSLGQIEFIKGGIQVNIRNDGRKNNEQRNVKINKSHLICTSGSCKYEGEVMIYTGIKIELSNQPTIKVNISSMKKSNDDK